VGLSLGNDQLGYYTSSPTWPFINGVTPYHSDHFEYNVSPVLGDDIIEAQVHNLGGLGFATDALAVPATPLENNNYAQGLHPGLQALAYPFAGDADSSGKFTTLLEGIFGNAAVKDTTIGQVGLAPGQQGPIHWVFDDGTPSVDTPMVDGRHSKTFTHAFSPGTHTVHLAAQDTSGDGASWDFQIYAYPQLTASVTSASNGAAISYTGSACGGQGTILAWRWTFSDGTTASGQTVTHQFATGVTPGATLTVTDGSGTTATAQG
jgi:hypothetical protein